MFLAVIVPEWSWSADAPVSSPIAGIDDAAMAKSETASKLIGNKVSEGRGLHPGIFLSLRQAASAYDRDCASSQIPRSDRLVCQQVKPFDSAARRRQNSPRRGFIQCHLAMRNSRKAGWVNCR